MRLLAPFVALGLLAACGGPELVVGDPATCAVDPQIYDFPPEELQWVYAEQTAMCEAEGCDPADYISAEEAICIAGFPVGYPWFQPGWDGQGVLWFVEYSDRRWQGWAEIDATTGEVMIWDVQRIRRPIRIRLPRFGGQNDDPCCVDG